MWSHLLLKVLILTVIHMLNSFILISTHWWIDYQKCVRGRPKTCTKRSQVRGVRPHVTQGLHWLKFVFHLPGVARDVRQRCTHRSASWGRPDSLWRHHETRPRVVWRYITCVFWETDAVACVWCGFGRPLPPLMRHLARWPNIKLGWPQPLCIIVTIRNG